MATCQDEEIVVFIWSIVASRMVFTIQVMPESICVYDEERLAGWPFMK